MEFDLIVIGSGPGGYHAAIRAAQLGLNVACVEKDAVGGVCLNIGCIPTKALLHVGAEVRNAKHAESFGVTFGEPTIDLAKVEGFKQSVVKRMTSGVGMLFKGNKVTLLTGAARFVDPTTIAVGGEKHSAKKFIVATGSRPVSIPGFELDGERARLAVCHARDLEAHHAGPAASEQAYGHLVHPGLVPPHRGQQLVDVTAAGMPPPLPGVLLSLGETAAVVDEAVDRRVLHPGGPDLSHVGAAAEAPSGERSDVSRPRRAAEMSAWLWYALQRAVIRGRPPTRVA